MSRLALSLIAVEVTLCTCPLFVSIGLGNERPILPSSEVHQSFLLGNRQGTDCFMMTTPRSLTLSLRQRIMQMSSHYLEKENRSGERVREKILGIDFKVTDPD